MTDLGNLGAQSTALQINSRHQIIGVSRIDENTVHAFLWEKGGPMIDLNKLIPPNSSLELAEADNINDLGEIVGRGLPDGCDDLDSCGHVFLLIPCDGVSPCESEVAVLGIQTATKTKNVVRSVYGPARRTPLQTLPIWSARMTQR